MYNAQQRRQHETGDQARDNFRPGTSFPVAGTGPITPNHAPAQRRLAATAPALGSLGLVAPSSRACRSCPQSIVPSFFYLYYLRVRPSQLLPATLFLHSRARPHFPLSTCDSALRLLSTCSPPALRLACPLRASATKQHPSAGPFVPSLHAAHGLVHLRVSTSILPRSPPSSPLHSILSRRRHRRPQHAPMPALP